VTTIVTRLRGGRDERFFVDRGAAARIAAAIWTVGLLPATASPSLAQNGPHHDRSSSMSRIACICFALALLPFATSAATAQAQLKGPPPGAPTAASTLSPVDYNFVAQANLGAPFQIESGRVAETKATTAGIRDYAHLMVMTHIPVVDALNAVLQRKGVAAPPNTLLHGAYDASIASLKAETGAALDRDYVEGQVEYQKGNAALFQYEIQNGTDPDLKEFARHTLPKIEDHLQRAVKLAESGAFAASSSK
jgi:putative membrane protein